MTARWETEFWSLLSPDTARRLKVELGIGTTDATRPHSFLSGVESDAEAPPAVATPDVSGGAVLRWLIEDAAALVALGLFIATLAVWASIVGSAL